MAIYTNELEEVFLELREANTKYSIRVLELEKENTRLDEENHKLAYSLSQSVPVESSLEQYDRIKELEKENAELKKTYARNIEAMTGQISNDLLSVIKKYPTALPYICELRKEIERLEKDVEYWKKEYVSHSETMCKCQAELQATKEQLKKCESSLDDYAICNDVGATARRYFIDKQKDEVKNVL
jgi:chromosome segregation ATPase